MGYFKGFKSIFYGKGGFIWLALFRKGEEEEVGIFFSGLFLK